MWVNCATQECHAWIPSDAHQECLCHAPCTLGMSFQPVNCPVCSLAVAALLRQSYLMGYKPQHFLLWQHWRNLQKLASKEGVSVTWVDATLPLPLGFGHARASPTPSLRPLLNNASCLWRLFPSFKASTISASPTYQIPAPVPAPSKLLPLKMKNNIKHYLEFSDGGVNLICKRLSDTESGVTDLPEF